MSKSRLSSSLDPSNSYPTDPSSSAHSFSNSCSTAFLASTPLPTTYFLTARLIYYCCLTLPWLFSRSSPSIFLVYAELSLLFHLLTSFLGYSCIFSFRLICSYLSCILLLLFKYFWYASCFYFLCLSNAYYSFFLKFSLSYCSFFSFSRRRLEASIIICRRRSSFWRNY